MYKTIEEIGGYKIGDEVPAAKAEVWQKMYKRSPVEKVGEDGEGSAPEAPKDSEPGKAPEKNPMLDDYLDRNTNVVKKAIEGDDLPKDQVEELLKLEKSEKKRDGVLQALEKKLKA